MSLSQSAARHLRLVRDGPIDLLMVNEWLHRLSHRRGSDIFRIKGVLAVAHADRKYVCHAVHTTFMAAFDELWADDEPRSSKLVFIGRGLDEKMLADSFNSCLATKHNYDTRAANLRFAVGDKVDFLSDDEDGWVDATVIRHMFRDEYMAPGVVAPYQIQRHDFPPGWTTWADRDDDSCIRRAGTVSPAQKVAAKTAAAQRAASSVAHL